MVNNSNNQSFLDNNFLIKGNNLIALHSILPIWGGGVKLIYIDPPYNTGSDSFSYNDRFNHSTWLTFMKNRLTVARDLLRDDGVILIQTDDNECHYLKVLCDEIFQRKNFVNQIAVKTKTSSGASGGGQDKRLKKHVEYILFYAKNKNQFNYKTAYNKTPLKLIIGQKELAGKNFEYNKVLLDSGKKVYLKSIVDGQGKKIKIFRHENYRIDTVKSIAKKNGWDLIKVYEKYYNQIYTTHAAQSSIRHRVAGATKDEPGLISIEYTPVSGKNKGRLTQKLYTGKTKRLFGFLKEVTVVKDGKIYKLDKVGTLWDKFSWAGIKNQGNVSFKGGKKPIELVQEIVMMFTEKRDLIIDFFAGSGTTGQAVWRQNSQDGGNRQFVLIEQLEEHVNLCRNRLRQASQGATTNNGFIYCQLAQVNQDYVGKITGCQNANQLDLISQDFFQNGFVKHQVSINNFSRLSDWAKLTLKDKKQILLEMVDLNQIYLNFSEMDDVKYDIKPHDKKLTRGFYSSD